MVPLFYAQAKDVVMNTKTGAALAQKANCGAVMPKDLIPLITVALPIVAVTALMTLYTLLLQ
jgi:hypothetical protein